MKVKKEETMREKNRGGVGRQGGWGKDTALSGDLFTELGENHQSETGEEDIKTYKWENDEQIMGSK